MPVGIILIGVLIATICSILLVPHRASGKTMASVAVHVPT